ncbi:hypothetical protein A1D29_02765 [Pasteurellaceae bacterium Orientalotternb1]|nr:hypothetical protein A1D29_02765 [Pasteurellaceae bacterium Orientalotternb1]
MKKSLIAFVIASLFVVTACDDKTTSKLLEAEKKIVQLEADYKALQNSLSSKEIELADAKQMLAKAQESLAAFDAKTSDFPALQVEIVKLFSKEGIIKHAKDPKDEYARDESSVSVFISTAKTGVAWLDQILLQSLYEDYVSKAENNVEKEAITEAAAIAFFDKMFQESEAATKEDKLIGYTDSANTYYLGQRNHIATFSQFFHTYSGGAHGLYYTKYLNIDTNKKAVITLNDLVSPKHHERLKELLWGDYEDQNRDERGNVGDLFAKKDDFYVSENFYFTPEGVKFVYPIYSLAAFADGETELLVRYLDVKDLFNNAYVPNEKDGVGLDPTEY